MSLFSPTLREPSLMLAVVDLNGSGAATLESFWVVLAQLERRKKSPIVIPFHTWCKPWLQVVVAGVGAVKMWITADMLTNIPSQIQPLEHAPNHPTSAFTLILIHTLRASNVPFTTTPFSLHLTLCHFHKR